VTEVLPDGEEPINQRTIRKEVIKWCVLSGHEVLEGPYEWPGKYFPIIPVWGKETFLDGKRRTRGLIRFAKDDQRLHNYAKSVKAEMLIMAPKAPWIATAKMLEGYEQLWNLAHQRQLPYLLYNHDPNAPGGKPERVQPINIQSGVEVESSESIEAMKANTGIYDPSLGNQSNEISGKAILLRQQQGDTATFAYIDNLSRALTHLGNILIDLIPKIYTGERVMQIVGVDGKAEFVPVNTPVLANPETGEPMSEADAIANEEIEPVEMIMNDLTSGRYQVTVTVGPSYATQRIEAAETMMDLIKNIPELFPLVADLLIKNMDWPESERIARRVSIMVPPEAKAAEEGREYIPPQAPPGTQDQSGQPGAQQ
jgi:hypothetical protein